MSLLTPLSNVFDLFIDDHMKRSFIDYSMSVITDRALADVRDGLQPVHRRILFAMWQKGFTKVLVKSAKVVGEVIGTYHPHGDSSVYGAAVRMAQDWTLAHPLIDGHGNFGSMDDDPPAAMRYTEMRMTPLAMTFFNAISKNVVDMQSNYDETEDEPKVLPVLWPHILANGGGGIAVGMAALIPPHNLGEVISAYLAFITNPSITTQEILQHMPAPDFPTGGLVHGLDGYCEAVETGRGSVKLRATWHEEAGKRGAATLVIDSLPYDVNTKVLVEKMADAIESGAVQDIERLKNESSSKEPVRIVAYLKPGTSPEVAFNQFLNAAKGIEKSFSYNINLLINGQPRVMGFAEIFGHCLAHAMNCICRETQHDLDKAIARLHILEGLMIAIGKLDETIAMIRAASDAAAARESLVHLLAIDIEQAQAILDLRLQKLTGLELDGLNDEHRQTVLMVKNLQDILANEARQKAIVVERVESTAAKFAHERRTKISETLTSLTREDIIPREDVVILATKHGYIKRVPVSAMNRQNRGTRGKSWMSTDDDDFVVSLHPASTHDYLLCFTTTGQLLTRKAFSIPESNAGSKGRHLSNVFDGLEDGVVNIMAIPEFADDLYLVTVSAQGSIKRTPLSEYQNSTRKFGVAAVKIEEGDSIVAVDVCRDYDHIILTANNGKAIRFIADEKQMRPMGRNAVGTRGMTLGLNEKVISMAVLHGDGRPQQKRLVERVIESNGIEETITVEDIDTEAIDAGNYLLCMGERGVGKCTLTAEFPVHGRGGKGVQCFTVNTKTGALIAALGVQDDLDLVMVSAAGVSNRIRIADIRVYGRGASGIHLMNLDKADRLVDVAKVVRAEEEEEVSQ